MTVDSIGAELFQGDKQTRTVKYEEANSHFCNFAKAPKKFRLYLTENMLLC